MTNTELNARAPMLARRISDLAPSTWLLDQRSASQGLLFGPGAKIQ